MWEHFIVTKHVMERYFERTNCCSKEVMKRIKKDLNFTKVKRVVNIGNVRHVFTVHSKEFIFVNDNGRWILRTIIKRKRHENEGAIAKRLKQSKIA